MKRVFDLILFFLFLPISVFLWFLVAAVFLPSFLLFKLFKKNIFTDFSGWLYRLTAPLYRREIISQIKKGSRVLDVGAGNCYLAKAILQKKKAHVTCTDVADFNKTNLPLIIFDGISLPFQDKMYDFVILSYVLHHAQTQERLLKECARVCRGKILVLEDEPVLAGSLFAKAHQAIYNLVYNVNSEITYYSPQEWRKIFKKCGLEIKKEESKWGIGSVMALMKRAVFVLKPEDRKQ